jgi:hypothetical protein
LDPEVAARVGLVKDLIEVTGFENNLSCNASLSIPLDLFVNDDEISCGECAFGDAIILHVLVLLALFSMEDSQKFGLVGDQQVDGIMVVSSVGNFKVLLMIAGLVWVLIGNGN